MQRPAKPSPVPLSAGAMFSADVALRWLPDMHRMALALAPGDPLLALLQNIAAAHPLSCAALPPPEGKARTPESAAWQCPGAHPGLWRLFIDRVIAANARWWLHLPEVRPALDALAGRTDAAAAAELRTLTARIEWVKIDTAREALRARAAGLWPRA
jgi:hypothetical protein